jgi:glycosyltransferase involved in cell wall biosynthesis
VRTYNFLRSLASRHEVDLISFVESDSDASGAEALSGLCSVDLVRLGRARSLINMGVGLFSRLPYQALYYRSAEMSRKVKGALSGGRYDLVYVHLFRMVPFTLGADGRPMRGPTSARAVVDLTDAISSEIALSLPRRPLPQRLAYRLECAKIRSYEAAVARLFDQAWVISDADAAAIQSAAPGAEVVVVPNGVATSLFSVRRPASGAPRLLFVGNLSVGHNIDAVRYLSEEVLPGVRSELPNAELRVVGHSAGPDIRALCSGPGITLAGHVADLEEAYADAAVFVAPLRFAAGVQNKILEAMAAGLPVVTTPVGNRGLAARENEEILVRDDAAGLTQAVIALLRDRSFRESVGQAGRAFVQEHYSWDTVRERAEALVEVEGGR